MQLKTCRNKCVKNRCRIILTATLICNHLAGLSQTEPLYITLPKGEVSLFNLGDLIYRQLGMGVHYEEGLYEKSLANAAYVFMRPESDSSVHTLGWILDGWGLYYIIAGNTKKILSIKRRSELPPSPFSSIRPNQQVQPPRPADNPNMLIF
jgi:hypothetical protein